MATIKLKRGTTTPGFASLVQGEPAIDTSGNKLFIRTGTGGTSADVKWIGAEIETSPGDWTSATKLATQGAINTTFMPKAGGAFTGDVTLNAQSDLRFADSDSSNWVAFQAPTAITSNVTWTLPSVDGSNGQFLSTNGSGTLSWASTGTATTATNLSGGAAGSIPYQTASSTTTFLSAGTSGDILTYGGSAAPVWSSGTGTGSPVRATAPTFGTSIDGGATFGAFASSTTLTIGSTGTGTSTTNISTGAVTTGGTKTINIGTGAAAGGTTDITIGATSGTSTVYIKGNLQVDGTTTTINTTNLTVDDLNIIVGDGVTTAAGGDGAGLSVGTSGVTFTYNHSNTSWQSTENFNIVTGKAYKINGTNVLTGSALGSGVTGSSLTSVGTLTSGTLGSGFTTVAASVGGTGQSTYTVGDLLYASGSTALSKLSSSSTAGSVLASTGSAAAPEYKTISLTNGSVTSGAGTLTLAVQNAAADGTTKGIAAFNSTSFSASSGVIDIATVDGGTY